MVWLHLHTLLEMTKLQRWRTDCWWVGGGKPGVGGRGYNYEGVPKQPLVFGGVLYSDHAGVSLSMEKQAPWKNTLCDI